MTKYKNKSQLPNKYRKKVQKIFVSFVLFQLLIRML